MACLLSVKLAAVFSNLASGLADYGVERSSNPVINHAGVDRADLGSRHNFQSFDGVVKHSFVVCLD